MPVVGVLASGLAHAQAAEPVANSGDTAWMLVASALVLLMTPGLALFYGGMVRRKNVLATFMYSFFALALVTVQWVLFGYSLAFGKTHGGFIGGFDYLLLNNVSLEPKGSIPHLVFMAFQLKFAIITPALISGAFVERMRFSAYVIFTLLWTTLVYDPVAHWTWAEGGWLFKLGVLDFAGGTVVHWTAGLSALICALYVGKRLGYGRERFIPHDLPMTVMGAGLLWFGWFGFNAGSSLSAGPLAALAFVTTHVAAGAAALSWTTAEWFFRKRPTLLGFVSGLVAGLVAITPAAGFVSPGGSLAIGIIAGVVCYGAVLVKEKLHYDDSLDAWGVHGVGGLLGALLVGVFSQQALNPAGADGLLQGNPALLGKQALAVLAVGAYTAVVTLVLLKLVDKLVGLRVTEEEERMGLDSTQHGEAAYTS
ncbi:Ammonium transporter [Cystobacter fuscus DSM 2262]|uniref:Ammonium transporter n=1 Tax=Cystobacter fuscus (strain ATCC 25194 / DSM 2262 / NBRC 100088 / M29) TaxID=1242864 RepID=S9PLV1_CYSF2|nr:ammonium transporter [Cystobacter fuscus]EPX65215.1 Ammonium transporter [Cystobacter fuscus DSM 2262]